MPTRKRIAVQRRTPTRRDALATVQAIYGATTRILRRDGRRAVTTNRIAEVAGISIGTLYGYFADKEEILLAMARLELDKLRDQVIAGMTDPALPPLRGLVRALIAGYADGGSVRRILMETMIAAGHSAELNRPLQQVAEAIGADVGRFLPVGATPPDAIALYLLTRSIDGLVRSATYEEALFLREPIFEDEIMRLVTAYLLAAPRWTPDGTRGGSDGSRRCRRRIDEHPDKVGVRPPAFLEPPGGDGGEVEQRLAYDHDPA